MIELVPVEHETDYIETGPDSTVKISADIEDDCVVIEFVVEDFRRGKSQTRLLISPPEASEIAYKILSCLDRMS